MGKPSDIRVIGVELFFLPVQTRVPLKFGSETLTSVTCARVRVKVCDRSGQVGIGWGETPLSVQWVWPSLLPYEPRHKVLQSFCKRLAEAWASFESQGHPLELGTDFQAATLSQILRDSAAAFSVQGESIPWLAALVCCSPFDLAIHDAFGQMLNQSTYALYGPEHLNRDLSSFLEPAEDADVSFGGHYPDRYLAKEVDLRPWAWHLVGGLDPLDEGDLTGDEPNDRYPVLLTDWIRADGLKCLKIKLRGNDSDWDYQRLRRVGEIANAEGVLWLTADFNCTVSAPEYVNEILDRLRVDDARTHGKILYVEQPFPYDLEKHRVDVRTVSRRKPLFLDESAHDWRLVRLGRSLGWTGVALKTCKTQTGALLSACWARAHGMDLMVQDLTNPMLAQIPHVLLAAHIGTIRGVETNSMQFYPAASDPEAAVHPGIYRRRKGRLDLTTIDGPGFGYCLDRIQRTLPESAASHGQLAEL